MKSKGGYIGMILLLIVVGVVLMLVARAWSAVAPEAISISNVNDGPVHAHGQVEAAAEVRSGGLPDLKDVQTRTDAHASDVQDALQAIE